MKNIQQIALLFLTAMSFISMHPAPAAQATGHHNHGGHTNHSSHNHTRPDSHAPIGVMGDHLMRKGEVMLSYRFMSMAMDGNRSGTESVGTPLPGYMVSPLSMEMDMHMFSAMYALMDKLSVMLTLPYTSISMDHQVNMSGAKFTTESSDIGDVKLGATYRLFAKPGADFLFNFVINAPTGSIDERDNTTSTDDVPLPYPMQLGSGTWDFTPGLTYVQTYDNWSWGAQGLYTFRTGTNDNGYTLGDRLEATAWMAKRLVKSTSLSFRLKALDWDNISGSDNKLLLSLGAIPTADPNLRGGTRVDALLGVNFVLPALTSLRLAAEAGMPVYQKLDGPQLETDLTFTLGAQYTF